MAGKQNKFVAGLSKLFNAFLVFVIIFCAGLVVSDLGEILAGEELKHGMSTQLGMLVFFSGIAIACSLYLRRQWGERGAVMQLQEEQLILNHAKANKGVISVTETSLECGLRISDTKKSLERLALTSVCHIDVGEQGELIYRFPAFEPERLESKVDALKLLEAAHPDEIKISLKNLERELEFQRKSDIEAD